MTDASVSAFKTDEPGWVYVIQAELTGLIKIGIAVVPESRMRGLQGGSPDRLTLLALFRVDRAGRVERALHRELSPARSHGEWFRPSAGMLAWAAKRCSANPDYKIYVQAALDDVWCRRGNDA